MNGELIQVTRNRLSIKKKTIGDIQHLFGINGAAIQTVGASKWSTNVDQKYWSAYEMSPTFDSPWSPELGCSAAVWMMFWWRGFDVVLKWACIVRWFQIEEEEDARWRNRKRDLIASRAPPPSSLCSSSSSFVLYFTCLQVLGCSFQPTCFLPSREQEHKASFISSSGSVLFFFYPMGEEEEEEREGGILPPPPPPNCFFTPCFSF